VRDFFLNGGAKALIVRVVSPNFATDAERDAVAAAVKVVADAVDGAADLAAAKTAAEAAAKAIEDAQNKSEAEKKAARALADKVKAIADGTDIAVVKQTTHTAATSAVPGKALLRLKAVSGTLLIEAASEGAWANALAAHVDTDGIDDKVAERFASYGLVKADLFNLTLRDIGTGTTEQFRNLTIKPNNPRSVDAILKDSSNLARVRTLSTAVPEPTDTQVKAALDAIVANANASQTEKDAAKLKLAALSQPFKAADEFRYSIVAAADQVSDGGDLSANDLTEGNGLQTNKRGLYALAKADLFNLLCIPPLTRGQDTPTTVLQKAVAYCVDRRAMLIVDPPTSWAQNKDTAASKAKTDLASLGISGPEARNAALYFPRLIQSDPQRDGQLDVFAPCGTIAGLMARTDVARGVWKAPAGLDATVRGVQGLEINLNDAENGTLNPVAINCLRFFPGAGRVVWGARTMRGGDQFGDEYKYVPVRRLALYIEETLFRSLQWVVFEPNDEPLWAQIRLNVGVFMQNLFRQGAFQGSSPREAYFVKCDSETTTQADINLGVVNIVVGFAPLKPAEFVIVKLQQMAGQLEA
jgi:phage tail sheath protein FI